MAAPSGITPLNFKSATARPATGLPSRGQVTGINGGQDVLYYYPTRPSAAGLVQAVQAKSRWRWWMTPVRRILRIMVEFHFLERPDRSAHHRGTM